MDFNTFALAERESARQAEIHAATQPRLLLVELLVQPLEVARFGLERLGLLLQVARVAAGPRHQPAAIRYLFLGAHYRNELNFTFDGLEDARAAFERALDQVTRVRGVRGAMVISEQDGLMVAEQLLEGIKGSAVAALTASLSRRLTLALEAAGTGPPAFWHLQGDDGALLAVPAAGGMLVVAVATPDVNAGLVRLELRRAAEAVG